MAIWVDESRRLGWKWAGKTRTLERQETGDSWG